MVRLEFSNITCLVTNSCPISCLTAEASSFQKVSFVSIKPSFLQNNNVSKDLIQSHRHCLYCSHVQLHCGTCWQTFPCPTAKYHSSPFISSAVKISWSQREKTQWTKKQTNHHAK